MIRQALYTTGLIEKTQMANVDTNGQCGNIIPTTNVCDIKIYLYAERRTLYISSDNATEA